MGKNMLGKGLAQRHEHGGPDHAVETNDVLTHDVSLSGPAVGEVGSGLVVLGAIAHGGHVVGERVEPHVGHVLVVEGDLNAPVEGRAGDGQVVQTALDKGANLVHAEIGLDEIGMLVIEREQLVLERGELEEPALLLDALERAIAVGAEVLALGAAGLVGLVDLGLGEEGLVRHAVPAIVAALVDVAGLLHALPQVLHGAFLARLGGADEVVVRDLQLLPQLMEVRSLRVAPLLRGHTVLFGGLGDLLAVLVHAGEKFDVVAGGTAVARLDVGDDRRVRGAQVRVGVHVVDGCGDVVGRLRAHDARLPSLFGFDAMLHISRLGA
ncbi:Uncharacterised protein [Collinsella intestinalis]|nr:Uncharacterised protein [Collinsella intestinalis]